MECIVNHLDGLCYICLGFTFPGIYHGCLFINVVRFFTLEHRQSCVESHEKDMQHSFAVQRYKSG